MCSKWLDRILIKNDMSEYLCYASKQKNNLITQRSIELTLMLYLPVILLTRLNLFLYLASGHTLSFFLSDYWCYSEYLSCPLCKLLSRLLNDAKECHISFSSSASSFSVYLWIINRREREREALGRRDMRRARKDNVDCLRFFYSFACQDHQVGLLLLIRKCLWYYHRHQCNSSSSFLLGMLLLLFLFFSLSYSF